MQPEKGWPGKEVGSDEFFVRRFPSPLRSSTRGTRLRGGKRRIGRDPLPTNPNALAFMERASSGALLSITGDSFYAERAARNRNMVRAQREAAELKARIRTQILNRPTKEHTHDKVA
jgi:hypothetical protein